MTHLRLSLGAFLALASIGHAQTATTTTLQVPSHVVAQGTPVLLQASVIQNGTSVTSGTVTFCPAGSYKPARPVPCNQLAYGTAQLTKTGTAAAYSSFAPGSTQVVAVYRGTKSLQGSVSSAESISVSGGGSTSLSLVVEAPSSTGQDFTATIHTDASAASFAADSVSLLDSNSNVLNTISPTSTPLAHFTVPSNSGGLPGSGYSDLACNYPDGLVTGDFDGDGIADLAYGCSNSGIIGIRIQLGKNPGHPSTFYTKNVEALVVGDFNSDGFLDLVTDSGDVLLGNGDGTFAAPVQTLNFSNLGGAGVSFVVADFDDDGTLDLGVGGSTGFGIFFNSPVGFAINPVPVASQNGNAVAADFDGDGIVDLAFAGSGVVLGNGDGTFGQPLLFPVQGEYGSLLVVDMNLDGKPDLILSHDALDALIGNGDGTFYDISIDANEYQEYGIGSPQSIGAAGFVVMYYENIGAGGEDSAAIYSPSASNAYPSAGFDNPLMGENEGQSGASLTILPVNLGGGGVPGILYFGGCDENDDGCNSFDPGYVGFGTVLDPVTYDLQLPVDLGEFSFSQSETLTATYTSKGSAFTASTSNAVTVAGQKTEPDLVWQTPAPIVFGSALSNLQLNAKANVAGTFVYSPSAGSILSAGTYTLSATFTPTDTTTYATATIYTSLTVTAATKKTPTIIWTPPAFIHYGTLLSISQLNATASVSGSFTYNPTFGTQLSVGNHTLTATFTPTDTTDYNSATQSATLAVYAATPVLTWPTPAAITYGTALSSTQLDATAATTQGASLAGSFAYSPASGTVLAVGSHTLTVTFSPSDTVDYVPVSKSVTLTVTGSTKTNPVITWSTPAAITYGAKLSATQLDATANVAGSFIYSPSSGTELSAGSHNVTATFTPTNKTTYNTVTKSVTLTVNKANAVLTWATPASITYGTKLSATQLDCKSNITGTFVYSPAAGTELSKGTHTLSATFTPSSGYAADYNQASKTVSVTVK